MARMQANLQTVNKAHRQEHDWDEECDMTPDCKPVMAETPAGAVAREVEKHVGVEAYCHGCKSKANVEIGVQYDDDYFDAIDQQTATLRERVKTLTAALEKDGGHSHGCRTIMAFHDGEPCDCGYDAALTKTP